MILVREAIRTHAEVDAMCRKMNVERSKLEKVLLNAALVHFKSNLHFIPEDMRHWFPSTFKNACLNVERELLKMFPSN